MRDSKSVQALREYGPAISQHSENVSLTTNSANMITDQDPHSAMESKNFN